MIKKKSASKEENEQKKETEQSEYKENKDNTEPTGQAVNEGSSASQAGQVINGNTEAQSSTADKVVTSGPTTEEKLAEMQDKYIRLSAEFDNYRKRTLREKMELSKYASENLLLQILPFMDDFDRALQNIEDAKDCAAVKQGIDLIHTKFLDFLKQSGISEVDALNSPFNIDQHDAVAKIQVEDEAMKGKVVEVIQKGYYLLDKVIRHSKVVVGE